jgi:hypothetical protein
MGKSIVIKEPEDLFNLGWYTGPDPKLIKAEEAFENSGEVHKKFLEAGGVSLENYQAAHRGEPALILGSGPSYKDADPENFEGLVFSCNAAMFEEESNYGVAGDPAASLKMVESKDCPPIIVRTNEEFVEKHALAIVKRKDAGNNNPVILMSSPLDCVKMPLADGTSQMYFARMTGTVAFFAACFMHCNPIIFAGIDYVPYSPERMSRYDVTPYYKVPKTHDANVTSFRGAIVSEHWVTEIQITESGVKSYIMKEGAPTYRIADTGLLHDIPVIPDYLRKALWS